MFVLLMENLEKNYFRKRGHWGQREHKNVVPYTKHLLCAGPGWDSWCTVSHLNFKTTLKDASYYPHFAAKEIKT